MSVRAQLGIGLALVGCAVLAGYLLGRRPDPAQERRIGELVERTRVLEAQRAATWAVADSASKRAAHSDSAARVALRRADRALAGRAVLTDSLAALEAGWDSTVTEAETLAAQVDLLTGFVDTLSVALTETKTALAYHLEVGARLRTSVADLVAQGQADSTQIARLQTELLARGSMGSGLSLSLGGGWKRAALYLGAGFIAGAIVTR